jgi:hypothetical protein
MHVDDDPPVFGMGFPFDGATSIIRPLWKSKISLSESLSEIQSHRS